MIYLVLNSKIWLNDPSSGLTVADEELEDSSFHTLLFFPPGEGRNMLREWFKAPGYKDGTISGVFADWIEDHAGDWEPSEIEPFVVALRGRLTNPHNNQTG